MHFLIRQRKNAIFAKKSPFVQNEEKIVQNEEKHFIVILRGYKPKKYSFKSSKRMFISG